MRAATLHSTRKPSMMSKERLCMYRAACPTLLCHSLLPSRTVQEMSKLFRQQTIRKAAGPDNVSSFTLKNCANELFKLAVLISTKTHRYI